MNRFVWVSQIPQLFVKEKNEQLQNLYSEYCAQMIHWRNTEQELMSHLQKLKCEHNHEKLNDQVKLAALMVQLRKEQEAIALLHIEHAGHQQTIKEHHADIAKLKQTILELETRHSSEATSSKMHATQLQLLVQEKQAALQEKADALKLAKQKKEEDEKQIRELKDTISTLKTELADKKATVVVNEPKIKQTMVDLSNQYSQLQELKKTATEVEGETTDQEESTNPT